MGDPYSLAGVVGDERAVAALVVTDGHALSAATADDQSLEEGGAFARRAAPAVVATARGVGGQRDLVLLEDLQGDVAGVHCGQEDRPLVGSGLPTRSARRDRRGGTAPGRRRPRRRDPSGATASVHSAGRLTSSPAASKTYTLSWRQLLRRLTNSRSQPASGWNGWVTLTRPCFVRSRCSGAFDG